MTKKVNIDIVARDKTKRAIDQSKKGLGGLKTAALAVSAALATVGAGRLVTNLVRTGKEVESLRVRFKFLFGSAKEGKVAFDNLAKFAGRVPFSLEEISAASGNLAVVSKDANDLSRILEITGNVAAVTGLDFQTTASQIQRAFSGGIAAADVFREKGVRSLLGFQQGATVSIEETVKRFEEVFGNGGRFGDATNDLANTFEGTVSMLGDKLFTFKNQINETFFTELKKAFGSLNTFFENNERQTEALAQAIGRKLSSAVQGTVKAVVLLKDNLSIIKGVFAGIIALKVATIFAGIATSIMQMRTAMIAFNTATKANIIFGGIAVFTGLIVALNARLNETKVTLESLAGVASLDITGQIEAAEDKIKELEINLEKASGQTKKGIQNQINAQNELIGTLQETLDKRKAIADEEALTIQEQARMNSFKRSPRDEIKASKDLTGIIQANKTELELLTEKNDKEFAMVHEQLVKLGQIRADAQLGKTRELSEEELALFNQLHETKVAMEHNFQEKVTAIHKEAAEKRKQFDLNQLDNFKKGKFQEVDFQKMSEKDKLKGTMHHLEQAARANASHSKKAFRIVQAFEIGKAMMQTFSAVTNALSNIPAPFNFVVAAANLAMGMGQVNAIRSQQPPAQFGGVRVANEPFLVGEKGPELFTPATAGTVTPNHQLESAPTHIVFNINTVDAKGFGALLDTRKAQIVNMINSARNQKGQSNIV
jgi:hypothetical protein